MNDHQELIDTPRWLGIAHLGVGSTGSVQLVEDKLASEEVRRNAGHMCAAKVLYLGADIIPTAVTQHSELCHSNVVRFIDAFPASSARGCSLCIVTELAAGGNLWTLLRCAPPAGSEVQLSRRSTWDVYPFLEAPARCVMQQATLALQYLHAKGVYGVALTPQDVLVSKWWMQHADGGGLQRDFAPIVLLGGFKYTRDHLERGTAVSQVAVPSFLAPELHDRPPNAPPLPPQAALKADMWSLGVLLFFLLSGELPFTLCTELKTKHLCRVTARVQAAKFVEPAIKALDRMPLGAKLLLQHLLAPDPLHRIDTVEVLRHPWIQEQMPASVMALHTQHLQEVQSQHSGSGPSVATAPPTIAPPMPPPPALTPRSFGGLLGGSAGSGYLQSPRDDGSRSATYPAHLAGANAAPVAAVRGLATGPVRPAFPGVAKPPFHPVQPRFLPADPFEDMAPQPPPQPPPYPPPALSHTSAIRPKRRWSFDTSASNAARQPEPGSPGGTALSLKTAHNTASMNTLVPQRQPSRQALAPGSGEPESAQAPLPAFPPGWAPHAIVQPPPGWPSVAPPAATIAARSRSDAVFTSERAASGAAGSAPLP